MGSGSKLREMIGYKSYMIHEERLPYIQYYPYNLIFSIFVVEEEIVTIYDFATDLFPNFLTFVGKISVIFSLF
jgi:hypothetical protein